MRLLIPGEPCRVLVVPRPAESHLQNLVNLQHNKFNLDKYNNTGAKLETYLFFVHSTIYIVPKVQVQIRLDNKTEDAANVEPAWRVFDLSRSFNLFPRPLSGLKNYYKMVEYMYLFISIDQV